MNGFLFRMLFRRSHSALYQSLETHLSTIEQHLSRVTSDKQEPPLHVENILLETFHHASIAAYQAEDEINSTFNYYILLVGIVAVGLPTIQGLILQTNEQHYLYLPTVFIATAAIILGVIGGLSLCFLERFLQLAKERYDNIKTMNNIQDFYSKKLVTQMPDIDEIFSKQRGSEKVFSVPPVIRFSVITGGSLCIGGAIGIAIQRAPLFIILSAAGFVIAFALYLLYYYIRKSKMSTLRI